MELVLVTIVLALLQCAFFAALVGRARGRYGIAAPATAGHPDFERINRVHVNTLENLVLFLPTVWIFGAYVSALWAAALGALFIVARAIYAVGYTRGAERRGVGAGLTGVVNLVLLVGSLVGLVRVLI